MPVSPSDIKKFDRILVENGFEPMTRCLYKIAVQRFRASGLTTKREFLAHLLEKEEDIQNILASDAGLDLFFLLVLAREPEDCSDLVLSVSKGEGPISEYAEPPDDLMMLITGSRDRTAFRISGQQSAVDIVEILGSNELSLDRFNRILDFGCGCARVLRNLLFLFKNKDWHGSDANHEPIDWCKTAIPEVEFRVNDLDAGTAYSSDYFDFIYALSVFTHLGPKLQQAWMRELKRILRPGGYLLFTTHGLSFFHRLDPVRRREFLSGQLVVIGEQYQGENSCASFCPESYVRGELAHEFTIIDFIPGGARGNGYQDMYLLRR